MTGRRGPAAGRSPDADRRGVRRPLWAGALLVTVVVGCGEDARGRLCESGGEPTLELGTGTEVFSSLTDGQSLPLVRGPQGGCHLWLAFDVDGLDGRRVTIDYTVGRDGETFGEGRVDLQLERTEAGCQRLGYPAILDRAASARDTEVVVEVVLTDVDGRSAADARRVVPRWPETRPAEDPLLACGARL